MEISNIDELLLIYQFITVDKPADIIFDMYIKFISEKGKSFQSHSRQLALNTLVKAPSSAQLSRSHIVCIFLHFFLYDLL